MFITRPYWVADGYVHRVSSKIRGEEISQYLGGIDVNIHVKPRSLRKVQDGEYVDMIDGVDLIPALKERPKVKVIAMSLTQYEYLKTVLENEVFLIHHHHINFERFRRTRNENLVGGIIGHSKYAAQFAEELGKRVDLIPIMSYTIREDMLNFFKKIDYLIVWNSEEYKDYPHSHPTKLINAASFGIPSLSQPILAYKEFEGFYIHITDVDSLVAEVEKLKVNYEEWSDKVFAEAEKYHISRIAEIYKKL